MRQPTYVLDFDSTLVSCESLDELARLSLKHHEDQHDIMQELEHITHRGMAGELAFDESLAARLQLFAATRAEIHTLTSYLISHISPSALASRSWVHAHRNHLYIVSGGFEEYIIPIAEQLGILADHVFANRFLFDNDTVIGYDTKRLTSRPSGKALQTKALHLPHPIIAIGDGYTDYEIKAAGIADEFWAFTETITRPKVTRKADRVINSFDEITSMETVTV
jgi:D-3-phosphoglycerate dehydrogenase